MAATSCSFTSSQRIAGEDVVLRPPAPGSRRGGYEPSANEETEPRATGRPRSRPPASKPSARTRRAATGCAVFTTVVLGALALVWSSTSTASASMHELRTHAAQ